MFKYPTEQVIAIKQQLRGMYNDLCDLLHLPKESAPALMASEFGTKIVNILAPFGDEWKEKLKEVNPETGLQYGDLYQHFLKRIDDMSYEDAKEFANQLGINMDPKVLFPDDEQLQKVYQMYQDTVEHRIKESTANKDAFTPEKLMERYEAT
eukprot:UN03161